MRLSKTFLILAGFSGLAGIVLGALGAHALAETLRERETVEAWDTAVRYHFFHTAALLGLGVWLRLEPAGALAAAAGACWTAGLLIFCGTLYILALGGPGFLGPVTPIGGILFMAGWVLLGLAAWRCPPERTIRRRE